MARKSVAPLLGAGMVSFQVRVRAPDVVFFKGVLDAHEGLCQVFAERGGDLTVAAPASRARELDGVLEELCAAVGAVRVRE
jgi:hypothetical protein